MNAPLTLETQECQASVLLPSVPLYSREGYLLELCSQWPCGCSNGSPSWDVSTHQQEEVRGHL